MAEEETPMTEAPAAVAPKPAAPEKKAMMPPPEGIQFHAVGRRKARLPACTCVAAMGR